MGLFDRIRKLFSRSKSANTDNFRDRHGHEVVRKYDKTVNRLYQIEHNPRSNVSTGGQRSNVIDGSSSSIPAVSGSRKYRSKDGDVDQRLSSASRYQMPATSQQASKEKNTTIKPSITKPTLHSSISLHNQTNIAGAGQNTKSIYTPAVSQQDTTLLPDYNWGIKYERSYPYNNYSHEQSTTLKATAIKSTACVPAIASCKIDSSTVPHYTSRKQSTPDPSLSLQTKSSSSVVGKSMTLHHSSKPFTDKNIGKERSFLRPHRTESATLPTNVESSIVSQATKLQNPFTFSQFIDICPDKNVSIRSNTTNRSAPWPSISSHDTTNSIVAGNVNRTGHQFANSHFIAENTFEKIVRLCKTDNPTVINRITTEPATEFANPPQDKFQTKHHVSNYRHSQATLSPHQSNSSPVVSLAVGDSSTKLNLQKLNSPSEIVKPMSYGSSHIPSYLPCDCKQSISEKSKNNIDIKQYSLRDFTFKLQTSPKDKSFEPESVIYHNQWTECSAMILDEFGKPVVLQKTVELSSNSHVDFRDSKIKKGRLHFRMKSCETGNIPILIRIDNCTLTKEFCVTCNPCSSSLSEMTIDSAEDKFIFRVFIYDVFGEPVSSPVNCKLEANFQTAENKVDSKEKYIENGQICYNIRVSGDRPWSRDLVVLLNGEPVRHAEKFELTEEECVAVNCLNDEDYEWILDFFDEDDHGIYIPLSTGNDDGKYVAYDENDCELQPKNANSHQLICRNVTKYDILPRGNSCVDFAHIDNIKRVLQLKDRVEIQETPDQRNTIIVLGNIQSHRLPICKEVVQHLLRGLYYRRKASQTARTRMEWKDRLVNLEDELFLDRTPSIVLCKHFKDYFGNLMNKYNREACNELFRFFNFQREENEVDLHGLLVANEEKLESLRLDMLRGSLSDEKIDVFFRMCKIKVFNGRRKQALKKELMKGEMSEDEIKDFIERCRDNIEDEYSLENFEEDLLERQKSSKHVDAIISKFRSESDEAIRKLKETLESFNLEEAIENNTPWLEIIVGAGHHSRIKNEQNIRPKVEKLLKERNLEFTAVNKGSIVVTFKTYSGPEPCFGEYYCENCNRCWKSSKSYVGKYQKCSTCKVDCWPVKQREKEKVVNYRRDGGVPAKHKSKPHQSSLCQKCMELGYPCNEEDFYDSD